MDPLREVARARRRLEERPATGRAVHEARVSLKRARAVLKLARGTRVAAECARARAACRRAARALAPLRDERALIETLEDLLRRARGRLPPKARDRARALARRERRSEARVLARGAALRLARGALRACPRRPGPAAFERAVVPRLGKGLRRSFRRARRDYRAARSSPRAKRFHDLRKDSKALLLELEEASPRPRAAALADLRRLTKVLGREHDLSLLRDRLGRDRGGAPSSLLRLARRRRRKLRRRALVLAKGLFSGRGRNVALKAA